MTNFMFFEFFLLNYDDILQNWRQEHYGPRNFLSFHVMEYFNLERLPTLEDQNIWNI